ncbi:site-specific DNA-methyltransferase, partial [bacterium]|nr:site-specific DNA-methyltransferase [bacterium]
MDRVVLGDNLKVLRTIADASVQLIYIDPPFNTGGDQRRESIRAVRDAGGDRVGFGQQRYRIERLGERAYRDEFDYYLGFLEP